MKPPTPGISLRAAELWLLFSAWCSLNGWILSVAGALHPTGCAISLLLSVAFATAFRNWRADWASIRRDAIRWPRRLRRPAPFLFAAAAVLACLGGALYDASNYDNLTYRLPQVLHWLAEGRWHWIDTWNPRMNISAVGFSWAMLPLVAFTKSSRSIFVLNAISFLLLPGLLFSLFSGAGVRRRTAWWWMWLLPLGYGYVLQAGSSGNDLFATTYVVAALAFAFRFQRTHSVYDASLSLLAAALFTGVKVVMLPLLLPWAAAILPGAQKLRGRICVLAITAVVAVLVSIAPTILQNFRHAGSWSGDSTDTLAVRMRNPVAGIAGNGLQLLLLNLAPPVMPSAGTVNAKLQELCSNALIAGIHADFPRFLLRVREIAQEETAALGPGLLALLIASAAQNWRCARTKRFTPLRGMIAGLAAYAALLIFCGTIGSESGPRLLLGYYPLLVLPFLLSPANDSLTRQRWWRALAALGAGSALLPLILTPARPLWPASTVLAQLRARWPDKPLVVRMGEVLDVYAHRPDNLATLRPHLSGKPIVGFLASGDDSPVSLWRPFESRRVREITSLAEENPALAALRGGEIVVSAAGAQEHFASTAEQIAEQLRGRVLAHERLLLKASAPPEDWYVIHLYP